MSRERVVMARIGAAHGVRGEVRLKSYADVPKDVAAYGPLTASDGRSFSITSLRPAAGKAPDMFVVRLEGVDNREAAQALTGTELGVAREALPATEADEFYHADLIGLAAVTPTGEAFGTVVAVYNHGAGDILDIAPAGGGVSVLVPFTRAAVPEISTAEGRLVVAPDAISAPADEPENGDGADEPDEATDEAQP